jgi:hypothetical protein
MTDGTSHPRLLDFVLLARGCLCLLARIESSVLRTEKSQMARSDRTIRDLLDQGSNQAVRTRGVEPVDSGAVGSPTPGRVGG